MLSHTGTLWQYLGSFVFFTLLALALIYGVYWYSRQVSGGLWGGKRSQANGEQLEIESTLALEPHKNIYVIRSGQERFLIAASGETTQLLSKLEPAEKTEAAMMTTDIDLPMERPWYDDSPIRARSARKIGFGSRFVQSVQWLVSSRSKLR